MGRVEGVSGCSGPARGHRRQTAGEIQEGAPGERSVVFQRLHYYCYQYTHVAYGLCLLRFLIGWVGDVCVLFQDLVKSDIGIHSPGYLIRT